MDFLLVHAPEEFSDKVMAFRKNIGLSDLVSESHLSIIAALHQPVDLEEVKRQVMQVASSALFLRVQFDTQLIRHCKNGGVLVVITTIQLLTLRKALQESIADVIQSGGNSSQPYQRHVTLYQSADEEEAVCARQVAGDFDFGDGFDAESIELVGRIGPPRGGTRMIIASYGFKRTK